MKNLLLIIMVLALSLGANSLFAQSKSCDDPEPDWPNVLTAQQVNKFISSNTNHASPSFNLRIKFHVLRETDGSTGPNASDVNAQVAFLSTHFGPHNISYTQDPINFIDNSNYVDNTYVDNLGGYVQFTKDVLYPAHGATNRLDVFVWPEEFGFLAGNAIAIPNDYMAISEVKFSAYWEDHIAHEIGHCLNLLHTHQNYQLNCPNSAKEQVDGDNCATAGDRCCDTNASWNLDQCNWNSSNCTYNDTNRKDCENAIYTPDLNNVMSYAGPCRSLFTLDQRNRMWAELSFGNKGPALLVCNSTLAVTGTIEQGLYSANNTVTCNGVANSGTNVILSAGSRITFAPGAKLLSGSKVKAALNGCSGN